MTPSVGTWVLKVVEGNWLIVVRPMSGIEPPYDVRVFEEKTAREDAYLFIKTHVTGVETALETAGSFIVGAAGGKVDRARLSKIGRDMDAKPVVSAW